MSGHSRVAGIATGIAFTLAITAGGCFTPLSANPPSTSGARETFRILEWNVSDSEWVKHQPETRAVLRHADPDVFILVQVAGGLHVSDVRQTLAGLRGVADTTWYISVRPNGSSEHVVIASRDSIRDVSEFALVSFPSSGRAAALIAPPDSGQRPSIRDTGDTVRTSGAMVRVAGQWVMVVSVHLTCCGTADTWREYRRQVGASAVAGRIRAAISRSVPGALVVAGDMNLVSGTAALDTILNVSTSGPLGPMRRADAVQHDGRTDWTWDGRGTTFTSGRLDNLVYSSGRLAVTRARVWDTEAMPADTLRAHGLAAETSRSINRHRPVVVDFKFVN